MYKSVDKKKKRQDNAALLSVFGSGAGKPTVSDPQVGDLPVVIYFQF